MFFLVRKAFWLVLVLAMVPFFAGKEQAGGFNVDPVAAFMAAQATVSDLTGFCGRNPQACETGGEALAAIGANARDGAKLVYRISTAQRQEVEQTIRRWQRTLPPVTSLAPFQPRMAHPAVNSASRRGICLRRRLHSRIPPFRRPPLGRCHGPIPGQSPGSDRPCRGTGPVIPDRGGLRPHDRTGPPS